jgi:hypothetical protein
MMFSSVMIYVLRLAPTKPRFCSRTYKFRGAGVQDIRAGQFQANTATYGKIEVRGIQLIALPLSFYRHRNGGPTASRENGRAVKNRFQKWSTGTGEKRPSPAEIGSKRL